MSLENFNSNPDNFPQKKEEGVLTQEQRRGIVGSVRVGYQLTTEHPQLADDYRSGMGVPDLVEKYQIKEQYNLKTHTAKNAIRYALKGYDGRYDGIKHALKIGIDSYPGLLEDNEEARELGRLHRQDNARAHNQRLKQEGKGFFGQTLEEKSEAGKKGGQISFENKLGIHARTPEQMHKRGRDLAESQGKTIYGEEEIQYITELSQHPHYKRGSRLNMSAIVEEVNRKFHRNQPVRTAKSIDHLLRHSEIRERTPNVPYSEEELTYIDHLTKDPDYRRGALLDVQEIVQQINKVFHEGKPVRTSVSIFNKKSPFSKWRREDKQ